MVKRFGSCGAKMGGTIDESFRSQSPQLTQVHVRTEFTTLQTLSRGGDLSKSRLSS